jgi:hypothetical protein
VWIPDRKDRSGIFFGNRRINHDGYWAICRKRNRRNIAIAEVVESLFCWKNRFFEEFAATLRLRSGRREEQWGNLLATISELAVGDRAGRFEPRPKNYKLMR